MHSLFNFIVVFIFSTHVFAADMTIPQRVAQDLCSTEGLMRLVPQLKNNEGKFQIPDPVKNPKGYLDVHTALTTMIEMALVQAISNGNPYQVSTTGFKPLTFGPTWRSAEVGVETDGRRLIFPENRQFASYGGVSFMSGITQLNQGAGYYYSVNKPNGDVPALVYVQPTILSCVNRINLAAANTVGTWLTPTYALGNVQGEAYLVVDKCLDLGHTITQKDQQYVAPNAILFAAIHWADVDDLKHMRTNQKAHVH